MQWLEGLKRLTIPEIAGALNLKRGRQGTWGPCPLCSAERRSSTDRRGPMGLNPSKRGAKCHSCNASIDIVDLASLVQVGGRFNELSASQKTQLRADFERFGWVSPGDVGSSPGSRASRAKGRVKHLGQTVDKLLGNTPRKKRKIKSISSKPSGGSSKAPKKRRGGGGGGFPWLPEVYAKAKDRIWTPEGANGLSYLRSRGYSDEAIRHWELGVHLVQENGRTVEEYITIPCPDDAGRLVNYRFRSIPGPCLHCMKEPPIASGGEWKKEENLLAGMRCRVCKGAVWNTRGGPVCELGHGGAEEPGEPAAPQGPGCPKCIKEDKDGNVLSRGVVLKKYRPCTGQPLPLFGSNTLSGKKDVPVLVFEGELDVVAGWMYGYRENIVTGTAGAGTIKDEWVDLLEPYDSFLLCHDDDKAGNEGAEKFATQIGRYRCSRVRFPHQDLGECLTKGVSTDMVERAILRSKPISGPSFQLADHYFDELEALIEDPEKLKGYPYFSRALTRAISGAAPGLTIVTGDTGCGKTTLSHFIGYRLCKDHGVPCAVTSFEQRPIGSVQKLIRAELGDDFTKVTKEARKAALGRLAEMPFWVLDHYGHLGAAEVIESIRYAARRHGVRWFLVDHLGFLISDDAEDERRAIEQVVRALALLANQEGLMIWLVCHPSNAYTARRDRVRLTDLKGASAIRQDANVGLVVQRGTITKKRPWAHAVVHVDKVRSEFGNPPPEGVVIPFDPIALHYADNPDRLPTLAKGGLAIDPKIAEKRPSRKRT